MKSKEKKTNYKSINNELIVLKNSPLNTLVIG